MSILITSDLNSASDRLVISSWLSSIFGALICSFILATLFLCPCACYVERGGALGIHQGRATLGAVLWHCMWGGVQEGTVLFAQLWAGFQSLPPLPISKLCPSGADSWVGGFVYVLGPCGCLQQNLPETGSFSCCHNSYRFLQSEVLRLCFPVLEPWVAQFISLPSCSSGLSTLKCGTAQSSSRCLAASPLCPTAHLRTSDWYRWMFLFLKILCIHF